MNDKLYCVIWWNALRPTISIEIYLETNVLVCRSNESLKVTLQIYLTNKTSTFSFKTQQKKDQRTRCASRDTTHTQHIQKS